MRVTPEVYGSAPRTRSTFRLLGHTALLLAGDAVSPRGWRRSRAERDREIGRRLAATLGEGRGVFTKLGQCIAMRPDHFSDELRAPLATLLDRAPASPFPVIRAEIVRGLGSLDAFEWLDPAPLAAASIAQVHRARLRDGREVVVKVRHPELTPAAVERQLKALTRALRLLAPWLGRASTGPLVEELGSALRGELDFRREGKCAEALAQTLAANPRVRVPQIHWNASGENVLTLEYVPTLRLDDPAALARRGFKPAECLRVALDAYGTQVFGEGLFHADPHPGNVLVVDEASEHPRILFVDFGLAERLPNELRRELRSGLQAVLKRDVARVMAGLERIGAVAPGRESEARAALTEALAGGAADALSAGAGGIAALTALGKRLVRESDAFRVPRELVLWARTLAYLYGLAERVAPGSDPMRVLLPHVLRFATTSSDGT